MNNRVPGRPASRRLTRRAFLRQTAVGAGAAVAVGAGYSLGVEPTWVETTHRDMPLEGLGQPLDGYRLVQISDLHAGPAASFGYLAEQLARVSEMAPDLVVITGDCVDGLDKHLPQYAAMLKSLRATDGVLAVLGNHDYYRVGGHRYIADVGDTVAAALNDAGVRVLRNETVTVRRGGAAVQLVGLEDKWAESYDATAAMRSLTPGVPAISLFHTPDSFPDVVGSDIQWSLAGHTHGGQVVLPLLGALYCNLRLTKFASGHYRVGEQHLYVNRGLGWLKRVRFNCRPEITVFTLRRANSY